MRAAILAVTATVIVCVLGLTADERPEPKIHTVTMENLRFQPKRPTVARGVVEIYGSKEGRVRLHLRVPSDDDGDVAGQVTSGDAAFTAWAAQSRLVGCGL